MNSVVPPVISMVVRSIAHAVFISEFSATNDTCYTANVVSHRDLRGLSDLQSVSMLPGRIFFRILAVGSNMFAKLTNGFGQSLLHVQRLKLSRVSHVPI